MTPAQYDMEQLAIAREALAQLREEMDQPETTEQRRGVLSERIRIARQIVAYWLSVTEEPQADRLEASPISERDLADAETRRRPEERTGTT